MKATSSQASGRNIKGASAEGGWVKAKRKNGKSRNGSSARIDALVEECLKTKDWKKARDLIQDELVYEPNDHWLWFTLSATYYEDKQYDKALACSKRAVELAPGCPLALWHYAGALYMTHREPSAFAIWTVLLNMDIDDIARGDHGEGMDWALQLVNDSQYRIGRFYQWMGKPDLARESFQKYLHNRSHGVGSIYERDKVEKLLTELGKG
jgi:tetratricopeptide (TPR) repeat protein